MQGWQKIGFDLCICFALLGPLLIWTEYRAARFAARTPINRYFIAEESPAALSLESHYGLLMGCDESLRAPLRNTLPEALRAPFQARCHDLAAKTLTYSPNLALGYLVRAALAAQENEPRMLRGMLSLSEQKAQGVTWMALRRVELGLPHLDDPSLAPMLAADIATLLKAGHDEAMALARRVQAQDAETQSFVNDRVASLSPQLQQRYVSARRDTR